MTRDFESPFSEESYEMVSEDDFFDDGEDYEVLGDEESESFLLEHDDSLEGFHEHEAVEVDHYFSEESDDWDGEVLMDQEFDDVTYDSEIEYEDDGDVGTSSFEVIQDLEHSSTMDEESPSIESEIQVRRKMAVRADPATPPCHTVSAVPSSVGQPGREPRHRPGAGRVRRTRSREYMKWVQRSLNNLMQTNLKVDGIWGRNTARVVRRFQKMAKIGVDGRIGPETEGALIKFSNSRPPEREVPYENAVPAVLAKAAALGVAADNAAKIPKLALGFGKFGFSAIKTITAGDLKYDGPTKAFGIRASSVPPNFNLETKSKSALVIDFVETGPAERVNIKLRCRVQYDGLNLDAVLIFDPAGRRSRLMRDTTIKVSEPLTIGQKAAPIEWRRCGVSHYRTLRIPISYSVDRPWPLDNYHESFELVLSTMYGLGAEASGTGRAHIQRSSVATN